MGGLQVTLEKQYAVPASFPGASSIRSGCWGGTEQKCTHRPKAVVNFTKQGGCTAFHIRKLI